MVTAATKSCIEKGLGGVAIAFLTFPFSILNTVDSYFARLLKFNNGRPPTEISKKVVGLIPWLLVGVIEHDGKLVEYFFLLFGLITLVERFTLF